LESEDQAIMNNFAEKKGRLHGS